MKTPTTNIKPSTEQIENFCQRWHIKELALFGSVLRDDFRPDSDIDILVTFDPQFQRGLTETLQIKEELQTLFDRKVDLIVKAAIERSENWLRRKNILESAQVIYAKRS
jgi:predicted nucleotidyltransferase